MSQFIAIILVEFRCIAFSIHTLTQMPHPLHKLSSMRTAELFSALPIAFEGQAFRQGHCLHCLHTLIEYIGAKDAEELGTLLFTVIRAFLGLKTVSCFIEQANSQILHPQHLFGDADIRFNIHLRSIN